MEIRPATEKDIPQIMRMKQWGDEELYQKRLDESKEEKASYLILEEDGQVLGHVFLKYYGSPTEPHYPEMEDLFIKEELRSKGLGSVLIKECEKLAKERGFYEIGLGVNPTLNPRAKALYERFGYKDVGRKPYLSGVYNGTEDWTIDLVKEI